MLQQAKLSCAQWSCQGPNRLACLACRALSDIFWLREKRAQIFLTKSLCLRHMSSNICGGVYSISMDFYVINTERRLWMQWQSLEDQFEIGFFFFFNQLKWSKRYETWLEKKITLDEEEQNVLGDPSYFFVHVLCSLAFCVCVCLDIKYNFTMISQKQKRQIIWLYFCWMIFCAL